IVEDDSIVVADPCPQSRQVTIALAHGIERIDSLPVEKAEYSRVQRYGKVGQCAKNTVEEREEFGQKFAPLLPAPSHRNDNLCAIPPGLHQLRQNFRRILEVAIHDDRGIAPRRQKT